MSLQFFFKFALMLCTGCVCKPLKSIPFIFLICYVIVFYLCERKDIKLLHRYESYLYRRYHFAPQIVSPHEERVTDCDYI